MESRPTIQGDGDLAPSARSSILARLGQFDSVLLVLLVLFSVSLRLWQIRHTEVAARDSIGFIRTAWLLRDHPWADVIRDAQQHPGYSIAILGMSIPVRHFVEGPDALVMQLSAQLASALAGVLLVFPMFYLGKELFGRGVGFWAAALFQCIPAGGRVLSDGLSEATFLLFAVAGMLLASKALRGRSPILFGLTGLFAGLAYLTRPEGAVVAAATGLVLFGMQLAPGWRQTWRQVTLSGVCLLTGWALVAVPYVQTIGHLTVKKSGKIILQPEGHVDPYDHPPEVNLKGSFNPGPLLAIWRNEPESIKAVWGFRAVCFEVAKGFGYIAWVPALLGLWWFRGRLKEAPGSWVLVIVCAVLWLLLWRLAAVLSYVSERHTVLVTLCGCYPAVAGTFFLATAVARWFARPIPHPVPVSVWKSCLRRDRFWSGFFLLALIGSVLPKTLEPLHANRGGFRNAGLWIAEHGYACDDVLDPYCWTHYWAGKVFEEGQPHAVPAGHTPICYVVLEKSGNDHLRLTEIPLAKSLAEHGQLVFQWAGKRNKDKCVVCVYACPLSIQAILSAHQAVSTSNEEIPPAGTGDE